MACSSVQILVKNLINIRILIKLIDTTKTSEENVHTKAVEPEPHESDAPIENSGAEVSG